MDCRFSCLIFPFYANKFPISGFEKTAAYSTICSRIVSVKPVFSRKMCWFQRKKCADFKPFLRFSGNLSQPVFHENPIFCFNSFNMRIFEKFLPFDFPRVFHKIFNKFFFSTPQSFNFSKWVMRFQLFHTFSTIALLKKKSADSPFFWLFHRFNSPYYYY